MQWLSHMLLYGLYPGAPSNRKISLIELLYVLLDTWDGFLKKQHMHPDPLHFQPFGDGLLTKTTVEVSVFRICFPICIRSVDCTRKHE